MSGDTIRLTGKAVLEWALSLGAARTLRHHAARGASLVLAYHNVVPAESRKGGDVSLHLAFDTFRRQLDYLGRHTSVVSLADVLDESPAAMPETDRPRVAITFDDAYADAMQIALPELASRGMPATVFVAPALLGVDCTWWDRYLGPAQHESDSRRAHALDALAGDAARITEWANSRDWTPGAGAAIATEAELVAASELTGMTIGAHSMTHPNLARLEPDRLEWELGTALEWLRTRFAIARPWLAYPYGLTSTQVERAAGRAGYTAAFRVDGAWMTDRSAPLSRPRLNIPSGVSEHGFRRRLARR